MTQYLAPAYSTLKALAPSHPDRTDSGTFPIEDIEVWFCLLHMQKRRDRAVGSGESYVPDWFREPPVIVVSGIFSVSFGQILNPGMAFPT